MITVLGASGFIGSHLTDYLKQNNDEVFAPEKGDETIFSKHLGDVVYAIGITSDFRERPLACVDAHVCFLRRLIQEGSFNSLTYLSSTRVYGAGKNTTEKSELTVNPNRLDDIYNISKLMGESIIIHSGRPYMKVVRLSNVLGENQNPDTFLAQLLHEGFTTGSVTFHQALDSAKDYIYIHDAVFFLRQIAKLSESGIYNLAAGETISNADIADYMESILGFETKVADNAPTRSFTTINIDKIVKIFGVKPRSFSDYFPELLHHYQKDFHVS